MPRDGMCHKEALHGACVDPSCPWGHKQWRGQVTQPQLNAFMAPSAAPPVMQPALPQVPPGMPPPMLPNPLLGKGTHGKFGGP